MTFGSGFGRDWRVPRRKGHKGKVITQPNANIIRPTSNQGPSVPAQVVRYESGPSVPADAVLHEQGGPSVPAPQLGKAVFLPQQFEANLDYQRFSVVILSATPSNLKASLGGIFKNEPSLLGRVIVVDDGASKGLEDLPGVVWVKGKKPFIFSRNSNIGIEKAAPNDIILLNDDAVLQTPNGFSLLSQACRQRPNLGICAAGVVGHVGNLNQVTRGSSGVRKEFAKLAFVCVYIPNAVIQEVGPLDERFVGYGYEDDDYCTRVARAGFDMGVFDGCIVEHESVPSSFRAKTDYPKLITENRLRYEEKWRGILKR